MVLIPPLYQVVSIGQTSTEFLSPRELVYDIRKNVQNLILCSLLQ